MQALLLKWQITKFQIKYDKLYVAEGPFFTSKICMQKWLSWFHGNNGENWFHHKIMSYLCTRNVEQLVALSAHWRIDHMKHSCEPRLWVQNGSKRYSGRPIPRSFHDTFVKKESFPPTRKKFGFSSVICLTLILLRQPGPLMQGLDLGYALLPWSFCMQCEVLQFSFLLMKDRWPEIELCSISMLDILPNYPWSWPFSNSLPNICITKSNANYPKDKQENYCAHLKEQVNKAIKYFFGWNAGENLSILTSTKW